MPQRLRIHSELGLHITGARVNGKLVPLNYRFRNGDIVEIMTRPSAQPSYDWLNLVSSVGSVVTALGMLVFVANLVVSWRRPVHAADDPWGGYTLEWATTSPPPAHNFDALPPIRSERPVFDLRHPELRTP